MDWQQDFPYDHTVVDLLLPGVPGEADIQQLLRDTEEKLKLNACRSVSLEPVPPPHLAHQSEPLAC